MHIDRHAPLQGRKEILVSAPLEQVWSILTKIDQWPKWQPDVSSARLAGELAVGTQFHWKANGLSISSRIAELEPMQRISWTGKSLGMQAIHIWTLAEQNNSTQVTTEESISGWLARTLKVFDTDFLEKSLSGSLERLKNEAEQAGE